MESVRKLLREPRRQNQLFLGKIYDIKGAAEISFVTRFRKNTIAYEEADEETN
jgi:hypothetical protein